MKQFYFNSPHNFSTTNFHKPFKSFLLLFLLLPFITLGQYQSEWSKVFNQPARTASVVVGNDRKPVFISEGFVSQNQGEREANMIKLNENGETLWQLHLSEDTHHLRMDMQDNSYVISRNELTKINSSGQIVWKHDLTQYGTWWNTTFELDADGNAYIAGFTSDTELSVLKINSTNQKLWLQQLPFDNTNGRTYNLAITPGDALYVGGTEINANRVQQTTFYKLNNQTGAEIFKKTLAEQDSRYTLNSLRWSDSGHLYVFIDEGALTHGHTEQLITKYDQNGNLIWQENFLFESRDYYTDAILDAAGNILLLTWEQLTGGEANFGFGITRISPAGETIWHHTYRAASGNSSSAGGLALLSDGNIAIAGNFYDENNRQDVVLLIYDPAGNLVTENIFSPDMDVDAVSLDIAPDDLDNLYLAGSHGTELLTIKYTKNGACTIPDVIVKSDVIDCETNTAQLQSATNAVAATFSWTGPNGYTSNEQNPQVSEPGDYTLTITTGTNCSASSTVTVLPANTPMACYTIDFENETVGLISTTQTSAGSVALMGQPRSGDGYLPQNYAAIFESGMPSGDDDDLYTDDWGKVLIINQDQTEVPNDNRDGGLLLIDFGAIEPVTMQSLKVLDIDEYEDDSWVVLYDADDKELFRKKLQPLGNNSKQTVDLGNTPNVLRVRVFLGGTEGAVGSGAIDDIKFCVESAPCQEETATKAATAYAAPTLFSDKTTIHYKPTQTGTYEASLYDLQGNLVRQLAKGTATAGQQQQIEVQAGTLKSGLYITRIVTDNGIKTVKLIKQ